MGGGPPPFAQSTPLSELAPTLLSATLTGGGTTVTLAFDRTLEVNPAINKTQFYVETSGFAWGLSTVAAAGTQVVIGLGVPSGSMPGEFIDYARTLQGIRSAAGVPALDWSGFPIT
jgi:hypothetical protein